MTTPEPTIGPEPDTVESIIVLNDGETFTNMDGCFMATVPSHWDTETIEDAMREMGRKGVDVLDTGDGEIRTVMVFRHPSGL